jgi:site-specific DNA-cytosine methylase
MTDFISLHIGFHTAIDISGIRATVVAAFDINTNANLVYEKNFGIKVNTVWYKRKKMKEFLPKRGLQARSHFSGLIFIEIDRKLDSKGFRCI